MLEYIDKRSRFFWIVIGILSVAGVGSIDILTGSELSFSLFYLMPIVLVTLYLGRNPGLVISVTSAAMWFLADVLAGHSYSQPVIRYWNAVVRLGFFVVVTLLLPALKALEREKGLARTDDLTGAGNRRHFFEVVQTELDRSQRNKHPLTIAYFDIDGFKTVNDRWGHRTGDKLLCAVVKQAKDHLRKTDLIARLGGDEFAILFHETDQAAAQIAVRKIQNALLHEMSRHNWPVTFSIGVLTCLHAQITANELIKRTDQLMYEVKKNGKAAIKYGLCAG